MIRGQHENPLTVTAPAKINLGLEILGKRSDGFHEIRSVLAMIDIFDTLSFRLDMSGGSTAMDGVDPRANLIDKAIQAFRSHVKSDLPVSYTFEKRIPIAAGLGGASADAAATLVALNHLHGSPLGHNELEDLGATLGSDVPFFLGSPVSMVRGTGTEIEPISPISSAVLLVVPVVKISGKTAALYGRITKSDFSSGSRIERVVERLSAGSLPDQVDLENAFTRPLYEMVPELASLPDILEDAGCCVHGLSGAGPSYYALLDSTHIGEVAWQLESRLHAERFQICQTRLLTQGIVLETKR